LLEDAVKEARKKGAESLEFAEDHASEFFSFFLPVVVRWLVVECACANLLQTPSGCCL
jgi:hypothetical protein